MSNEKKVSDGNDPELIRKNQAEWEKRLKESEKKVPPRPVKFTTLSDMDVPLLSTPADLADLEGEGFDYLRDLGFPGEYPYTRGVQRNMFRGKLWTILQFA